MALAAFFGLAEDALLQLSSMLKPGVKVAFIARTPDQPERDILITDESDEDLGELAKLIERRINNLKKKPAQEAGKDQQ